MTGEDNFSVEVAVGELREEVRALKLAVTSSGAQVAELNGRIEGLVAMLESKEDTE